MIRGLGNVTESGVLDMKAPDTTCETWQSTPVLTVAGKGTIELSVRSGCIDASCGCGGVNVTENFTVMGGTDAYAAASGSGTLAVHGQVFSSQTDTLNGTIDAPATSFDLTPPVIVGASNKIVWAPRHKRSIHVRYAVSAQDALDGPVPVTCKPASGSRFRIGRKRVTCTAEDSSANTATAKFTVTVKRKRG